MELHIELQPKQLALYKAMIDRRPDSPVILGYGGARGGGKSEAIRRIALLLATEQPGVIIWIIRLVWDDLLKDHVLPLLEQYPQFKEHYRASNHELRIPVGNDGRTSSIFFIHAGDTKRSQQKARGPQVTYLFLDQAEQFTQAQIEQYAGSNRAPGVGPGHCKRCYCFNPGGVSTNFLRRTFYTQDYRDNERASDYLFIHAFGWDNAMWFTGLGVGLDDFYTWPDEKRFKVFTEETDFGRKLNALPPSQRIGELMGSFDQFSGQYYADVWEQSTHVLPVDVVARIIKPWWKRWLATDWGFSHYAATGWFADGVIPPEELQDFFGVTATTGLRAIILYRELVGNEVPEPLLARMIIHETAEVEKREVRSHFIGHDAFAKRGSANTVAEQMEPILLQGGLQRLDRADIDRAGGWRLLYNCFASARRMRSSEVFADNPADVPALFISSACSDTWQAIPMLICDYDPITKPNGNVQDVRKMHGQISDDVADMLRYGVKSFVTPDAALPEAEEKRRLIERYDSRPLPPNGKADATQTNKMMAMQRLEAKQQDGMWLRRKLRR